MSDKYSSPIRKLIPFFVTSRDKWKEKCQLAKKEVKRLKNNIQYMKNANQELKKKITLLEDELKKKQQDRKKK